MIIDSLSPRKENHKIKRRKKEPESIKEYMRKTMFEYKHFT